MRVRSTESFGKTLLQNYRDHGIYFYFFTDDNFARNRCWREIFEMLARMREEEKIPIQFMIQVDTQSHKIPDFVSMASRAGCTQVFIGMESINPDNLKAAGKAQNHVRDYRNLIAAWHNAKIATHVAYIFGFPFDTPESIRQDVQRLQNELGVEQASFFMLTRSPVRRTMCEWSRPVRTWNPTSTATIHSTKQSGIRISSRESFRMLTVRHGRTSIHSTT